MNKLFIILFSVFSFGLRGQISNCEKLNDAIIQENSVLFKKILSKNIDFNCKSKIYKSPLGTASAYGNKEFVQLLLKKKVDVNNTQFINRKVIDNALFDALSICPQKLEPQIISPAKMSEEKKRNKKNVCTNKDKEEIVRILVAYGANALILDEDNTTTLMMASMYGRSEILELLLNKGVNINARNSYGKTALIYAVVNNDYKSVKVLILAGADALIKDNDGKTALDIAKENNFEKLVILLSSSK